MRKIIILPLDSWLVSSPLRSRKRFFGSLFCCSPLCALLRMTRWGNGAQKSHLRDCLKPLTPHQTNRQLRQVLCFCKAKWRLCRQIKLGASEASIVIARKARHSVPTWQSPRVCGIAAVCLSHIPTKASCFSLRSKRFFELCFTYPQRFTAQNDTVECRAQANLRLPCVKGGVSEG